MIDKYSARLLRRLAFLMNIAMFQLSDTTQLMLFLPYATGALREASEFEGGKISVDVLEDFLFQLFEREGIRKESAIA